MSVKIYGVDPKSKIAKKGISAGDSLLSINGRRIDDFLDYSFYSDENKMSLEFLTKDSRRKTVNIKNCEDCSRLGMSFESFLMDKQRRCKNACIFCFVDQMPPDMRESLYFKDDDFRLSFLFGNYITLTNLSEHDAERIVNMHLSPVNISVHTMNPALRVKMMKNPRAGEVLSLLYKFSDAGIKINAQLVLCPGINDGGELKYSLDKLAALASVESIAAVPVGLTRFREGLYPVESYTPEKAGEVIDIIDSFNAEIESRGKDKLAYPSDEFFLLAGRKIPSYEYYGDFPQLDNGVGGAAMLTHDFAQALENAEPDVKARSAYAATGEAAYPFIKKLAEDFCAKFKNTKIEVLAVPNKFFGGRVTVAGLVTGSDLIAELNSRNFCGGTLILPEVMLKSKDEKIFLDNVKIEEIEDRFGTQIRVCGSSGRDLLNMFYSL